MKIQGFKKEESMFSIAPDYDIRERLIKESQRRLEGLRREGPKHLEKLYNTLEETGRGYLIDEGPEWPERETDFPDSREVERLLAEGHLTEDVITLRGMDPTGREFAWVANMGQKELPPAIQIALKLEQKNAVPVGIDILVQREEEEDRTWKRVWEYWKVDWRVSTQLLYAIDALYGKKYPKIRELVKDRVCLGLGGCYEGEQKGEIRNANEKLKSVAKLLREEENIKLQEGTKPVEKFEPLSPLALKDILTRAPLNSDWESDVIRDKDNERVVLMRGGAEAWLARRKWERQNTSGSTPLPVAAQLALVAANMKEGSEPGVLCYERHRDYVFPRKPSEFIRKKGAAPWGDVEEVALEVLKERYPQLKEAPTLKEAGRMLEEKIKKERAEVAKRQIIELLRRTPWIESKEHWVNEWGRKPLTHTLAAEQVVVVFEDAEVKLKAYNNLRPEPIDCVADQIAKLIAERGKPNAITYKADGGIYPKQTYAWEFQGTTPYEQLEEEILKALREEHPELANLGNIAKIGKKLTE